MCLTPVNTHIWNYNGVLYVFRFFSFGAGRRVCLGEAMAKNRLFLFVAGMLQKMTFHPADPKPSGNCRDYTGFILAPPSYKITVTSRNLNS